MTIIINILSTRKSGREALNRKIVFPSLQAYCTLLVAARVCSFARTVCGMANNKNCCSHETEMDTFRSAAPGRVTGCHRELHVESLCFPRDPKRESFRRSTSGAKWNAKCKHTGGSIFEERFAKTEAVVCCRSNHEAVLS